MGRTGSCGVVRPAPDARASEDGRNRRLQFSLRSLLWLTLAVSVAMAGWRLAGTAVAVLLALQALLGWILYSASKRGPYLASGTGGCVVSLALFLLPFLFTWTLVVVVLRWAVGTEP